MKGFISLIVILVIVNLNQGVTSSSPATSSDCNYLTTVQKYNIPFRVGCSVGDLINCKDQEDKLNTPVCTRVKKQIWEALSEQPY